MRPGDSLFIDSHRFVIETAQDDGYSLFVRLEPGEGYEAALKWLEHKKRTGESFTLLGSFRSTFGFVTALRESEKKPGVMRARFDLDESALELWWSGAA